MLRRKIESVLEIESTYIPLYMGFLVKDTLADVIIPDVDLSLLT